MAQPANSIQEYRQQISEAVEAIRAESDVQPRIGIICGTGMGELANQVENATVIPYDTIPNFPVSTVESHKGNLVLGKISGQPVMVMQGRFHFYEGYAMKQITFPVRVMKAMGCEMMLVMNAVGSMNPLIRRGSLVFIDDHINFMGQNPLIGPNDDDMGLRFPDMSEPYSQKLIALGEDVALKQEQKTHRGVLIGVTGPNLETRAEYRAFRMWGADTVGMSTIPEVIVAVHAGLKVLGISVVSDECYPDALEEAKLEDILAAMAEAGPKLDKLVRGILERIDEAL
ncbi:MAG: purine-nucleoside phosphorylase [Candidatus Sumerlaeia bacterium]